MKKLLLLIGLVWIAMAVASKAGRILEIPSDAIPIPLITESLRKKAEEGDPDAQAELGYAYTTGTTEGMLLPRDPEKALYWLQKSADGGSAKGLYRLGSYLMSGQAATKAEYMQGLNLIEKSSEKGYFPAPRTIGAVAQTTYEQGLKPDSWLSAAYYYMSAADKNDARAMYLLGLLLLERYPEIANAWILKAARMGEWGGQVMVIDKNNAEPEEIVQWLKMRLEKDPNNIFALYHLGLRYYYGDGVERDKAKGVSLLKEAFSTPVEAMFRQRYALEAKRLGLSIEEGAHPKASVAWLEQLRRISFGAAAALSDIYFDENDEKFVSDEEADRYESALKESQKTILDFRIYPIKYCANRLAKNKGRPTDRAVLSEYYRSLVGGETNLGVPDFAYFFGLCAFNNWLPEPFNVKKQEAEQFIETAARKNYVPAQLLLSEIYMSRGEKEKADAWKEAAKRQGEPRIKPISLELRK